MIRRQCAEKSNTTASLTVCPHIEVPPPRASTGAPPASNVRQYEAVRPAHLQCGQGAVERARNHHADRRLPVVGGIARIGGAVGEVVANLIIAKFALQCCAQRFFSDIGHLMSIDGSG